MQLRFCVYGLALFALVVAFACLYVFLASSRNIVLKVWGKILGLRIP